MARSDYDYLSVTGDKAAWSDVLQDLYAGYKKSR